MTKDLDKKIIELMDLFDDEQVTTADQIKRPEKALEKQAIDDFMKRNPMAGGGMLVQPSADGSRPGYARIKGVQGGSDYKPLTEDQTKLLKTRYADEIKKQGGYKKWRANPKNNWKVSYVRKGKITADTFKKTELDLDALEKIIDRTNLENKIYSQKEISKIYFDEKNIKPKPGAVNKDDLRGSKRNPEVNKLFNKIIPPEEKVNRVMEQMLISDEPLPEITFKSKDANAKANWRKYIINEVGEGKGDGLKKLLKNNKFYKKNAEVLNYMFNIRNDIEGMTFKDALDYATKAKKGMPRLSGMKGNFSFSPVYRTMDFAFRNWDANKGKGLVKFFDKNGKPITWSPGLKKLDYNTVSFSKGGKQTFSVNGKYNNSISIRADGEQFFPKIFEAVKTRNALLDTKVDDPFRKRKQILFSELINKIQVKGYGWSPDKKQVLEILHGPDGVAGNPFDNLKVGTSKLNNTLSTLDSIPIKGLKNKIMNQAYGQLKGLRGERLTKAIIDQQLEIGAKVAAGQTFPISDRTQIFMDALDPEKEILGPLSQKEKTFLEKRLKGSSVRLRNIETKEAVDNLFLKLSGQIDRDCAGAIKQASKDGGRIGLQAIGSREVCITKAKNYARDQVAKGITDKGVKGSLIKRIFNATNNFVKSALDPKELFDIKKQFFSKGAIASLPIFDAGIAGYEATAMNKPIKEAVSDTLTFGSIPRAMGIGMDRSQVIQAKNLLNNPNLSPAGKEYAQLIIDLGEYEKMQSDVTGGLTKKFNKFNELQNKIKNASTAGKFDFQSLLDETQATQLAKDNYSPLIGSLGDPLKNRAAVKRTGTRQGRGPVKIDLSPVTYENFQPNIPAKEEFDKYLKNIGMIGQDEMLTEKGYQENFYKPAKFEQLMETRGFRGTQDKFASGGRAGFRKGLLALINKSVKSTPKDMTSDLDALIKKTLNEDFFDKKDRIIDQLDITAAKKRKNFPYNQKVQEEPDQLEFYDDITKSNFKTKTGPFFDRRKRAGGGILKQAGDSSGPPPESGPMSQGLQGLMKRGMKI